MLAAMALSIAVSGQETPPKIIDIVVLGNKYINRETIVASSGLKIGDPLTQAKLDEAKRNLLQTYLFGRHHPDNPEEGVKIRAEITQEGAKVVIEVDENDLIRGINLTGTGPISPATVLEQLQTKEGRVLNIATLNADVDRIQRLYESRGYTAVVSEEISIKDGILHIPIIVARIGTIKVSGLKKTFPWVVTREMKLKSGDYYNTNQLRRDLVNIYNTDLFEMVDPSLSYPSPGIVDITLNVQEKRTGQVALGIGYSSRQQLVGRAELAETNFLGRGQQLSLLWETGGIANRNSVELAFTEPWLDRRHTSLSVSVFDKAVYRFGRSIASTGSSISSSDYFETHTGGSFMISRPFGETYRGFVGFRFDNVRVPNITALNPNDAAILQNGPLTTVSLQLTHNTRDFDLEPATGGYEILSADVGRADLKPAGGTQPAGGVFGVLNYTKYRVDVRRYFSPQGRRISPKDKRNVFALRLVLGSSTGTLPFSEQYFVGGAETLRGYNEDRFWGANMFVGSVEFRTPLANSLTGVIFADVGDAWGGAYENVRFSGFTQHSGFSPSVGVGVGLRVVTPIGPIRIDQGFGSEGARTHLSIGHVF
ncbi:MAG TPA: BamA/TamA family outer membrane protein [Chthonomonadales bacterium]|nr:BamA/TamA family outer membrane protein [Chthonomonadales bacterium]